MSFKINDFVIRFANVNGTGSASANALFTKAVFRMGIPVTPKNIGSEPGAAVAGLPQHWQVLCAGTDWVLENRGVI